jgi:hypothetical protein
MDWVEALLPEADRRPRLEDSVEVQTNLLLAAPMDSSNPGLGPQPGDGESSASDVDSADSEEQPKPLSGWFVAGVGPPAP